jgi:hypothetical protein
VLALLLGACAAASNPDRSELKPVGPPSGGAEGAAGATTEGASAEESRIQETAAAVEPDPDQPEPNAQGPDEPEPAAVPWAEEVPVVGAVGDKPIDLQRFLSRLWMRENAAARGVLEQLVMSRLTLLEAERLRMYIDPAQVDAVLRQAYDTMKQRLEEAGSDLTVEEHIRRNLEMDPDFYHGHLRDDAIVQLLAERCVRAWAMENGRTHVRMLELDPSDAEPARKLLEAGTSFDAVAEQFGEPEAFDIVRSEHQDLARLAFATEVGEVAGPVIQGGRYLLMAVDGREEPIEGDWKVLGPLVEQSLEAGPVEQREFVQWRAAMVRRYRVDLQPFLELVGDPGPGAPSEP